MKKNFEAPRTNIITCEMTGTILTGSSEVIPFGGETSGGGIS
mgnify:CR=1 FL=1